FDANGNIVNTNTPTISVTYSEAPHTGGAAEMLPAYAQATHRTNAPPEGSLPGDTVSTRLLRTVNFVDGLDRSLQVKKDITRDDGNGNKSTSMSVSGKTTFDARGRVYQQGQPTFGSMVTPLTFVTVSMTNPTQYAYDVLGRVRQEQHPDGFTQAITNI